MANKIITLTTDFGLEDGYVASMKGVILSISPSSILVDITHEIEPQNVEQASIVLATATGFFPAGTIHVAVVDPGVGTKRALLVVEAGSQFYIAPDNGLLGAIFDKYPMPRVHRIENSSLYLPRVSRTFHGRDIIAPIAAHLANGVSLPDLGPKVSKFKRGEFPHPVVRLGSIKGQIVYRDRFGNLMTNIAEGDLQSFGPKSIEVSIGYSRVRGLSHSYSDVEKGELLCLIGSAGTLEIALREGSAADKLGFPIGTEVHITGKPMKI